MYRFFRRLFFLCLPLFVLGSILQYPFKGISKIYAQASDGSYESAYDGSYSEANYDSSYGGCDGSGSGNCGNSFDTSYYSDLSYPEAGYPEAGYEGGYESGYEGSYSDSSYSDSYYDSTYDGSYDGSYCSSSQGQACAASSSPNSCGQINTNWGTTQCDGSCDASTPSPPSDPPGFGNSCSGSTTPNSCGDTTPTSGTIQCDSSCSASTGPQPERTGWGGACTSAPNSCGDMNSGTFTVCSGAGLSCSASTPAERTFGSINGPGTAVSTPITYGGSCYKTSAANTCGDTTTTWGTVLCDGSCSAATPTAPLCILGNVYDDATPVPLNGVKDVAGDANMNGVTMTLLDASNNVLASTTTATDPTYGAGYYMFHDLTAATTYKVQVTTPAGYAFTYYAQPYTNPRSITINADTSVNFGITKLYSIAGAIFRDDNKNTTKDGSEINYALANSTITLTGEGGGAISPDATTGTGTYSTGTTIVTDNYTVSYTTLPTGYEMTYPKNGPPPFFSVQVGAGCSVGGHNTASCASGNISNLNFGVTNSIPWTQFICSDSRSDNGIDSPVPATADPACSGGAYKSVTDNGGNICTQPGVVFGGDVSYSTSLGGGQASPDPYNWIVGGISYPDTFAPASSGVIRSSYDYISTLARQSGITPTDLTTSCGGNLNSCDLSGSLSNGIYKANSDLTLTSSGGSYTFPTDKNIIILVNGNLTIDENILVPNGATATFAVNGSITVTSAVGSVSTATLCVPSTTKGGVSTGCHIEGFYVANTNFTIEGNNDCSVGKDKRLNLAGGIIVNAALQGGSIANNRDICADNLLCPAVSVTGRPDFLLNAPDLLKYQNYIWQEIAP